MLKCHPGNNYWSRKQPKKWFLALRQIFICHSWCDPIARRFLFLETIKLRHPRSVLLLVVSGFARSIVRADIKKIWDFQYHQITHHKK